MGRIAYLPGTTGVVIPGAPRILMTTAERTLARMPGLKHYIDPAKLDATGNGRDRFGGALITGRSATANAKIAAATNFNNLPVIEVAGAAGGLRLSPGSVSRSYTFLCVASISAAGIAAAVNKNLFLSMAASNDFRSVFNVNSSNVLSHKPLNSASGAVNVSPPVADKAAVWCASYDFDTQEIAVISENGATTLTAIGTGRPEPTSAWYHEYGGGGAPTNFAWQGRLGIAMIFDRALHRPLERPLLDNAIATLKQMYAIT